MHRSSRYRREKPNSHGDSCSTSTFEPHVPATLRSTKTRLPRSDGYGTVRSSACHGSTGSSRSRATTHALLPKREERQRAGKPSRRSGSPAQEARRKAGLLSRARLSASPSRRHSLRASRQKPPCIPWLVSRSAVQPPVREPVAPRSRARNLRPPRRVSRRPRSRNGSGSQRRCGRPRPGARPRRTT
jgi:hypothetical protein